MVLLAMFYAEYSSETARNECRLRELYVVARQTAAIVKPQNSHFNSQHTPHTQTLWSTHRHTNIDQYRPKSTQIVCKMIAIMHFAPPRLPLNQPS